MALPSLTRLRCHPSRARLGTWFDDEPSGGVAWHISTCERCFDYLHELSRIRVALRSGLGFASVAARPVAAAATEPAPAGGGRDLARRRRPAVVAGAAAVLVSALGAGAAYAGLVAGAPAPRAPAASATPASPRVATGASAGSAGRRTGPPSVAAVGSGQVRTSPSASGPAGLTPSPSSSGPSGVRVEVGGAGAAVAPLKLAVVAPVSGPDAADGADVVAAAEEAVRQANAAGGVRGVPVQLTVVSATDSAAVSALSGAVDAVVGSFDADVPASVPWLMPADPDVSGSAVVPAELSAQVAGARLAADLVARGISGTIGVVEGGGPDAALASGLSEEMPVSTVQAPAGPSCLAMAALLERQGSVALAVAGPPSLAESCVAAVATLGWNPPGGVLVAPSAAYADLADGLPSSMAVSTVLGLPWPTSGSPGAERFAQANPGDSSYRALVTFAAVELAVDVARTAGSPSVAAVDGGKWHNDLFDFVGGVNTAAQVVSATGGGWEAGP